MHQHAIEQVEFQYLHMEDSDEKEILLQPLKPDGISQIDKSISKQLNKFDKDLDALLANAFKEQMVQNTRQSKRTANETKGGDQFTGLALPEKERELKYIKVLNYLEHLPTESDQNNLEIHNNNMQGSILYANIPAEPTVKAQIHLASNQLDQSLAKNGFKDLQNPRYFTKIEQQHPVLNMDDREIAKAIEHEQNFYKAKEQPNHQSNSKKSSIKKTLLEKRGDEDLKVQERLLQEAQELKRQREEQKKISPLKQLGVPQIHLEDLSMGNSDFIMEGFMQPQPIYNQFDSRNRLSSKGSEPFDPQIDVSQNNNNMSHLLTTPLCDAGPLPDRPTAVFGEEAGFNLKQSSNSEQENAEFNLERRTPHKALTDDGNTPQSPGGGRPMKKFLQQGGDDEKGGIAKSNQRKTIGCKGDNACCNIF